MLEQCVISPCHCSTTYLLADLRLCRDGLRPHRLPWLTLPTKASGTIRNQFHGKRLGCISIMRLDVALPGALKLGGRSTIHRWNEGLPGVVMAEASHERGQRV
jgi:hypothetical protein